MAIPTIRASLRRNSMRLRTRLTVHAALLALVAASVPARASDGVIEINQTKVVAAGGFPYTISQPGSYRLTSNLDVTKTGQANPQNLVAVHIVSDNVTLDLNGFAILGPAVCTGVPATCTSGSAGAGAGVQTFKSAFVIRNGTVSGFGNNGVDAEISGPGIIEGVIARGNVNKGIALNLGTVRNCVASRNGGPGVQIGTNGAASGNSSLENGGSGFEVFGTATGNHASFNGLDGIRVFDGLASNNTAIGNGSYGLEAPTNGGYVGNVLVNNKGATGNKNVSGGTSLGPNLCDAVLCP
jgi:hypothetical protein